MSNSEPILSEFLTKEELAAELRRNPRTLDRWAVLGMGPPRTHVGARYCIGGRAYRNGSSRKSDPRHERGKRTPAVGSGGRGKDRSVNRGIGGGRPNRRRAYP